MNDPVKIIKYIGETIIVEMQHRQTGESNIFKGIVTDISMVGRHEQQNHILIKAASKTIRLEGKPTMDSFVNKTLEEIINEVVKTSGNGAEVTINPKYKETLKYLCQYEESAFAFINRLSSMYGETFFNDGTTSYFGFSNLKNAISIKYDIEVTSLNINASLRPTDFQRYDYLVETDAE